MDQFVVQQIPELLVPPGVTYSKDALCAAEVTSFSEASWAPENLRFSMVRRPFERQASKVFVDVSRLSAP